MPWQSMKTAPKDRPWFAATTMFPTNIMLCGGAIMPMAIRGVQILLVIPRIAWTNGTISRIKPLALPLK